MLRKMRSDFQKYSWSLWLVIFAFVIGFIFSDPFRRSDSLGDSDVASVNGFKITQDALYKKLLLTIERYKVQFKENFNKSFINQLRIPENTLQQMIDGYIVESEADKHHIQALDTEVREKIMSIFQSNGQFVGFDAYRNYLDSQHMQIDDFENELRGQIKSEKFKELVTSGLVLNNNQLKEQYKKDKDEAQVQWVQLGLDRIKDNFEPLESDLKNYYEQNRDKFKSQEKRRGYLITYKYADYKNELTIPEKDTYDYFMQHKLEFVQKGKIKVSRIFLNYQKENREEILKKANEIFSQLTAANFSAKAMEFSQDDKAKTGGDYGYVAWQRFTEHEKGFCEKLDAGKISPPIDCQTGFSMVMVSEKIEDKQGVYDEVKDRIRGTFERDRLNKLVRDKLEVVFDKMKGSKDIRKEAGSMNVKTLETPLLAKGEPIKGTDEMGYCSRKLFEMEEQEVFFPLESMDGLSIIQLAQIKKPELDPYEAAKNRVRDEWIAGKKVDRLYEQALNIVASANATKDEKELEKFWQKENLKPSDLTYKRGNKLSSLTAKPGLDDLIFNQNLNGYAAPIRYDREVVLLKVKSKKITTDEEYKKDQNIFYNSKLNELRDSYFDSFINLNKRQYKVNYNDALFNKVKESVNARI